MLRGFGVGVASSVGHLERDDGVDAVPRVQHAIGCRAKPLTPRKIVGGAPDAPGGVGVGLEPGQIVVLQATGPA